MGYVARLKSGEVAAGVVVSEEPGRVLLGTTTGEVVAVDRASIEAIQPSSVSVKPEGLLKPLSPKEVRDLMGFLLLRRAPAGN